MLKKPSFKNEELINRTEAMTKKEMELILEHIPVELCLARVAKELERNKVFIAAVQKAVVKTE